MPETSLPVEYLFTMKATLATPDVVQDGPQGTRTIVPVTGGEFEGPRLKGKALLPAGDWLTSRRDGSGKLDVRVTLKTDDGAIILVTYNGIIRRDGDGFYLRTAPLFETSDERYAWLTTIQAVGVGLPTEPGTVKYDVYALK